MAEINVVMQDFQLENVLARIIAQYAGDEYCIHTPCVKHCSGGCDSDMMFYIIECDMQPPEGYILIKQNADIKCTNGYFAPPIECIRKIFELRES